MTNVARDPNLDFKFTKTHSLTVDISEAELHDHVTSAIEGGTNYWATVDVGPHQLGWANYFTATFTVVEMSDTTKGAIEGERYALSIEKLLKGLLVLREKYPHHFGDIMGQNGDATTGDVLVQCALFGDIVYG